MERAIFIRCENKTERNGQKFGLEISWGCPNLAAFLERAVSSCLYDKNEKNERSQNSFHFLIEQENMPKIHGMEEIFQVSDNLPNEEWSSDGPSVTSPPITAFASQTATIFEQSNGSCCLPVKGMHWSYLTSCGWLFKGHNMKSERLVMRTYRSFQEKYVLKGSTFIMLEKRKHSQHLEWDAGATLGVWEDD